MFNDKIPHKKERILRILTHFVNSNIGSGSGFFINGNGRLLTCSHVAFGIELKNFRLHKDYASIIGGDDHSKLESWFTKEIRKIEVELSDGSKEELELEGFDEKFDVALLKLKSNGAAKKVKYCNLDFNTILKQGDLVTFGGFPICFPYKNTETPFAINTGMVSSFPETIVGGERYEHAQLNAVNLGGNSGAPLFRKNHNKVVGIINGNMNFGNDNVLFQNPKNNQSFKGSFRVPLSIAYATSLKLLKRKSTIFTPDQRA